MGALWSCDVTGFCLTPAMPYAWHPRGSVIAIPTSTPSRRLNVLGVLNRRNALYPHVLAGKVDTSASVECFEPLSKQITKRTSVFLENAPMHRSQECIRHISKWVKRGLIIQYFPPYSPELNLIEILWRFIK